MGFERGVCWEKKKKKKKTEGGEEGEGLWSQVEVADRGVRFFLIKQRG